jgi:large subunit ribosomal protein L19
MSSRIMREFESSDMKPSLPEFRVGDTVEVRTKIMEGDKERIQPFQGVVIRHRGAGLSETFTVRRIVEGEGVERTFPIHSPHVTGVIVKRQGNVRRARLYYLRGRKGKAARIRGASVSAADAAATPAPAPAPAASKEEKKA